MAVGNPLPTVSFLYKDDPITLGVDRYSTPTLQSQATQQIATDVLLLFFDSILVLQVTYIRNLRISINGQSAVHREIPSIPSQL